jgi:hypothetical protein
MRHEGLLVVCLLICAVWPPIGAMQRNNSFNGTTRRAFHSMQIISRRTTLAMQETG